MKAIVLKNFKFRNFFCPKNAVRVCSIDRECVSNPIEVAVLNKYPFEYHITITNDNISTYPQAQIKTRG